MLPRNLRALTSLLQSRPPYVEARAGPIHELYSSMVAVKSHTILLLDRRHLRLVRLTASNLNYAPPPCDG
eukprot:336421-Pleurochrysis_carterae.AAC.1